ncbi:3-oxoacyl-[acyl-carrier-protein] reductase FabG-like [Aphomia sociella]
MSFKNKVVLVTGSSAGIGAATAIMFAKEGAKIVILGRNEDNLNKMADEIRKIGSEPLVIKADVSKDVDAKRIIDTTIVKFGKLDVLVNNAGLLSLGTILDGKIVEAYDAIANTNFRAMLMLTTLATPHLIKTGGNIVNISSIAGIKVFISELGPYGLTKAAVNHFTRTAALELSPHGVRVNTVSPGLVETDILPKSGLNISYQEYSQNSLLKRYSTSEEVAELIIYLASDKAKGITGSNFVMDNGMTLNSEH